MSPNHFLCLALFILFKDTSEEDSMITTWGEPTSYTSSQTISSISNWDDCVLYCYNTPNCVLSYGPSPTQCIIFIDDHLIQVKQLDVTSGLRVSFRIYNNISMCPIGDNPPTFYNSSAYGVMSNSTYTTIMYRIDFVVDLWNFTYYVIKTCPPGWTKFSRPTTDWCMLMFVDTNGNYSLDYANTSCSTYNAVVSGLETTSERDFVSAAGSAAIAGTSITYTGIWVSGQRRSECYGNEYGILTYCNIIPDGFQFDDQYMTNYGGYQWAPNQPDGNSTGTWQNCMQMWIVGSTNAKYQKVDDISCSTSCSANYCMIGFACGKPSG